jgi:hypothetical protein
MNNPWWSRMTMLFIAFYFFYPLNYVPYVSFCQGLQISIKVPLINPIHLDISRKCAPKLHFSSSVGHWIYPQVHGWWMMQSSHNANFDQFHIKAIHIVDIVMFHVKNEVQETLFKCQLWSHAWNNWNLTYYDAKQNIRPENPNPNPNPKNLHPNHNPKKSTLNPKFQT